MLRVSIDDTPIGYKFPADFQARYKNFQCFPDEATAWAEALRLVSDDPGGGAAIHANSGIFGLRKSAKGIIMVYMSGDVLKVAWRATDVIENGFVCILYQRRGDAGGHVMLARFLPNNVVDVFDPNGHGYLHPAALALAHATNKTLNGESQTLFTRAPEHKLPDDDAHPLDPNATHSGGMCQIICAMQMWSSLKDNSTLTTLVTADDVNAYYIKFRADPEVHKIFKEKTSSEMCFARDICVWFVEISNVAGNERFKDAGDLNAWTSKLVLNTSCIQNLITVYK